MKFLNPHHNERGAVLVTGLIFMAILSIMGTAAYLTSSNELLISKNYKTAKAAFYTAEAGIEEARGRLKGSSTASNADYAGDPATNPDATWSAYILTSSSWTTADDPYYDSNYKNYIPTDSSAPTSHTYTTITNNSLQSDISYWVKIRHKREADLFTGETYTDGGSTANDIIYYGYRNSDSTTLELFTTIDANPDNALPVDIITAYGSSAGSSKTIEVQVSRTMGPPITGAVYGDSVGGNGNVDVVGNDNCSPPADAVPAVAYSTSQTLSGGSVSLTSDAGETSQLASPINITQYVNALQPQATETLTSDQQNYSVGDSNNYKIVYCDATQLSPDQELDINNLTGYGTLVVRGDLNLRGNIEWHGLIIVSGNASFRGGGGGMGGGGMGGGGSGNIYGAVMADSSATLSGNVNVTYDSCEVDKARNDYSFSTCRWTDTGLI